MEDKEIIDLWRSGLTVQQVAKEYMKKNNKKLKKGEKRLTKIEAQRRIEPIIFKYQTSIMKGKVK